MINIDLKYPNGEVLAVVKDEETGSSTSIGGSSIAKVIQEVLDWADLEISISEDVRKTHIPVDEGFLQDLQSDSEFLGKLYAAGVENWEGFAEAQDM